MTFDRSTTSRSTTSRSTTSRSARAATAVGVAACALVAAAPAPASAAPGELPGVTASAPSCTAGGDVVITLSYPQGLPAGTSLQTNVAPSKFASTGLASADLGATSGTVTFSAADLASQGFSSATTAFGLATKDARVFQSAPFATNLCSGAPVAASSQLRPTVSFGTPVCRGDQAVIPVAVAQAGDASHSVSLSTQDNSLAFSRDLDAAPGTTSAYDVVVSARSATGKVAGPHTIWLDAGSPVRPTSVDVVLPSCTPAPAPAVTITGPTWACDTRTPSLTYRNETGERRQLVVTKEGSTQEMPVSVPAGDSVSALPSGLSGTFAFRDATSHALIATLTFDPEAACPGGSTTPPTPTSPTTPTPAPTTPTTPTPIPSHPGGPSHGGHPTHATPTNATHAPAPTARPHPAGSSATAPVPVPATGPKVETDHVAPSPSTTVAGLALLVIAGALAGRVLRRQVRG